MPTSRTWPGGATSTAPATYSIPASGELNWASLSDFLNALGDSAQATTFQKFAIRKATTTPVTVVANSDCVVVTDLAVAGAVAVNLPAGANKQVFVITDGKGDAGTNNITITPNGAETIAGSATLVLAHNRQGIILVYNSADTDWKIAGSMLFPGTITSADISGTIAPSKGGTGVANNDAATLTRSGNHALTITTTNTTNVTFPTSGTLIQQSSPTISSPTITGTLLLQNPSGSQPLLRLSEDPDNGTDTVTFQAPASLAASYTLTLPPDDGDSGEVLSTNGSGVLDWASVSTFSGSSTDNAVARFDGTAGALQNSGVILSDVNGLTGITTLVMSGDLTVDTNTLYVDSSNNRVGIKTTGPTSPLHLINGGSAQTANAVADEALFQNLANAGDDCGITILAGTTGTANVGFGDSGGTFQGAIRYDNNGDQMTIRVNGLSAMSLFSTGYVAIKATSSPAGWLHVQGAATETVQANKTESTSGTITMVNFIDGADTSGGTIALNTTANTTAYNTSSDARLKTHISDFQALSIIAQLNPVEYERLSNPGSKEHGFLAQELVDILPYAVTLGGDNPDRNPWGVDYSKVVGVLTKAIKELKAQFDAYVEAHP